MEAASLSPAAHEDVVAPGVREGQQLLEGVGARVARQVTEQELPSETPMPVALLSLPPRLQGRLPRLGGSGGIRRRRRRRRRLLLLLGSRRLRGEEIPAGQPPASAGHGGTARLGFLSSYFSLPQADGSWLLAPGKKKEKPASAGRSDPNTGPAARSHVQEAALLLASPSSSSAPARERARGPERRLQCNLFFFSAGSAVPCYTRVTWVDGTLSESFREKGGPEADVSLGRALHNSAI